jgi:hypothetical protein
MDIIKTAEEDFSGTSTFIRRCCCHVAVRAGIAGDIAIDAISFLNANRVFINCMQYVIAWQSIYHRRRTTSKAAMVSCYPKSATVNAPAI